VLQRGLESEGNKSYVQISSSKLGYTQKLLPKSYNTLQTCKTWVGLLIDGSRPPQWLGSTLQRSRVTFS